MRGTIGKPLGRKRARTSATFLGSLARDTGGNTMAIMAAALIPLCGMVGGGLDLSRMYLTKTRLQHACDAGALAGRKRMGSGTWTANSNAANAAALEYFNANFDSSGMYGGSPPTVAFAENAGKVTGTASATLPMTLTRVIGQSTQTLSVTCDAEMRLPNTDIMFVLDTTGSMADTLPSDTTTKIQALRGAVKCFYEIVARLDTTEVCGTGAAPSGGTGNQVQIRFGFMPYAVNVNVGKLLPTDYFANSWPYQTRVAEMTATTTTTWRDGNARSTGTTTSNGNWYTNGNAVSYGGNSYTLVGSYSGACDSRTPADTTPTYGAEGAPFDQSSTQTGNSRRVTYKTNATGTERDYAHAAQGGTCYYGYRERVVTRTTTWERTDTGTTTTGTPTFSQYRYNKIDVDISGLKNGTSWNSSFSVPLVGTNGAAKTVTWQGCIEERSTVPTTDFDPIPSNAKDLDIDLVPSQGDASTLWGPALPELVYLRKSPKYWYYGYPYSDAGAFNRDEALTTAEYYDMTNSDPNYFCPVEARKLQAWTSASTFESYVDSLTPSGNTYHDIGLIWGGRFMSPTGMFRSENEFTPQGGEIDRHMIFMTDGDACTGVLNYTAYGIPWFDRRQTDQGAVPTAGCTTNDNTLTEQVNLRTEALCTQIKNKNITLWVISFGSLASSTLTRLQNCATTSRYYSANNSTELYATFNTIANQISQLRLTR